MANRYPLIIDTADNQLKELADGDNLDLTGNSIVGVQNITATGNISANNVLIGGQSITTSINYNDLVGKPTLSAVATTGQYGDLNGAPTIPSDVSELSDNFSLLAGSFTALSDVFNSYTGRGGQFLRVNIGENGIESANVSTGGITDQDVIDALGYTPYDGSTNTLGFINSSIGVTDVLGYTPYDGTLNPNNFLSSINNGDILGALGYIPYDGDANPNGFINDQLGITDALGYTPYDGVANTSGFLTEVSQVAVLGALGYTPYNGTANELGFINNGQGVIDALGFTPYSNTNPNNYISSITSTNVIDALGYTPYSAANPAGYVNDASGINTLLGYTPYNGTTNPSGFLTTITDTQVIGALGYTPYNATTNLSNFINDAQGITDALGFTPYNGSTNPAGFLIEEADTLNSVTLRGSTTTNSISVGAITATGLSVPSVTLTTGINFNTTGAVVVDGGTGSSIRLGGTSTVTLGGPSAITVQNGIVPNNNNAYDLGTTSARYANVYAGQGLYFGTTLSSNAVTAIFSATSGSIQLTTAATGRTHVTTGTFRLPNLTSVQRTAVTPADGDMIYEINRIVPQIYFGGQWRDVFPQAGSQPATPWFGMIAIADGSTWNPKGDGSEALMCYLNDAWAIVA